LIEQKCIYDISPTETPFMSAAGRGSCDNTLFEWQTDALASAASNRQIEGDDASANIAVETVRLSNYTQISRKVVQTSGSAQSVDFAGKKSSHAYNLAKSSKELKRDMETMFLDNTAKSAGKGAGGSDTAAARASGGICTWLGTNADFGSGGSAGGAGTAATDGTRRTLTEAICKTVIKECFDSGGEPDLILCGSAQKQVISGFASSTSAGYPVSQIHNTANGQSPATMVAAIDVYVSDFGTFRISPDRFIRSSGRDVFFLDMDFWSVNYLRNFGETQLARTGDSEKTMLLSEYTLVAKNEKSSGWAADIT
jgi:hypothetical protein